MTSPETLNTKVAINELRLPLATHTVLSEKQFDCYGILKSAHGAELFLHQPGIQMNSQVSGNKNHESWRG
jgi:hypothetical protein